MAVNDAGRKSRSTETFLVSADVAAFGALLASGIEGLAVWAPQAGEGFGTGLVEQLAVDGRQAFLRLLDGQEGPKGPLIQYVDGRIGRVDGREILPDGSHVPVVDRETLTPGRLAYAWFPVQEPIVVRERFPALAKLVWQCLHQVTHPHVALWNGKPQRSMRIGTHAKQWLREDSSRGIGGPSGYYTVIPS